MYGNLPVNVDDTALSVMLVLFLVTCIMVGPVWGELFRTVASAYRFKRSDGEIRIKPWIPSWTVIMTLVSCACIALAFGFSNCTGTGYDMSWSYILKAFVLITLLFLLKQFVCRIVNTRLFRQQLTYIKPVRWSSFLSAMLVFSGMLFLLLCFAFAFIGLTPEIVRYCILLIVVVVESGVVFKIKTALFSSRCGIFGFLLYLCALEFGPLAVALVILRTNIQ